MKDASWKQMSGIKKISTKKHLHLQSIVSRSFAKFWKISKQSISANIVESFQYKMPALNSQSVILLKKDSATGEFVRGFWKQMALDGCFQTAWDLK